MAATDAEHAAETASHDAWHRRPDAQVGALTAVMLLCLIGLFLIAPDRTEPTVDFRWWTVVAIALVFGAFDYSVFNVYFRRNGISFSLSEIPLTLALVFVAPAAAIPVRLAVSGPVLYFKRRNRGAKLVFNLVLFAFEMMLAYVLFRGFLRWWGSEDPALISASVVTPVMTALTTSVLISIAISRYEGDLRKRVVTEIQATWWLYPVTSVLGAMTLGLALIEPPLALFAILPTLGMWYILSTFGMLNQAMRDLHTLHGFAGRVGLTLDPSEICEVAAVELFDDLRATGVALVRFTDGGPVVHRRGEIPARLPVGADDPGWEGLLSSGHAAIVSPDGLAVAVSPPPVVCRCPRSSPVSPTPARCSGRSSSSRSGSWSSSSPKPSGCG